MDRRRFLELLGIISLAPGLHLPMVKSELKHDIPNDVLVADDGAWWKKGSADRIWLRSHDMGKIWWPVRLQIIYISPNGDDANDGLTTQNPKRTIAAARDAGATHVSVYSERQYNLDMQ